LIENKETCWFCGYEGYLPTGWVTDSGEKLICPECDYKLDQILKHWDNGVVLPPKVSPPIPHIPPPTNPSSILTVTDVTKVVTKGSQNIGEKMEQCWGFGMPCATEDDFCPHDEVEECKKRNEE